MLYGPAGDIREALEADGYRRAGRCWYRWMALGVRFAEAIRRIVIVIWIAFVHALI